ncbi:hypothetical protein ONS95_009644 [Cadophora gregata]|uniref:uncharacterized protein n=1 Tax=Cadophora gregata TaxID=51156 RepID=UPI0026DA9DC1|nr:uncharacterized protein ONS95_009644 [Cadophora gregata]KAK0124701.1 hypothetical protein ONS95_009644 [Cadophora gregata]KAK0129439.1 hypothetical protein ONS96_000012 [Cadophora gregata f. sp. sojae]
MAFEYNQDSYWNGATFYQQNLDTVPLEAGGFFESSANPLTINTTAPQFTGNLIGEPPSVAYSEWGGSIQGDSISTGDFSPTTTKSDKITEGSSRGPRRPSAEAVARRRKQNRVSQAAWRARNKELVEELRQEISEYSEYTENMQQTMRSLLQTTESLKGVIENALAQQPPNKSSQSRPNGESQLMSPISSNDGPQQDTQDTQDCDGDDV